jgi:FKBP-type peptidyl-prolyl cis-trans isomerase SlyD
MHTMAEVFRCGCPVVTSLRYSRGRRLISAASAESKKGPMNQKTVQVEDNMVVSLAYVLTATNERAERSKEKQATKQIVQGRNQVVPGLEQALYGMSVGDEKEITVEPTLGYGAVNPAAIQTLRRGSVPSFDSATPGQRLRLLHKKSGELRRATVVDVNPETIVLDFNHPLAGKTLHYQVRIEDIRQATTEELESGQVVGS